jgi:LmbE family N-acetylglucosaminyl deacetylase
MNFLVIASHPDDEVLGCGGTIARLANEGHQVEILILGEGVTSRYKSAQEARSGELESLHAQALQVGEFLGAKHVSLAGLPDNRFDSIPLLEIVRIIEEKVASFRPEVVYTQHGGDLNIDHVQTFRATMTATRPMKGGYVRKLLSYEVASSSEWAFGCFEPVFQPNVFCDISSTLEKKIKAMEMYEGEARSAPHPRSPEALSAQATARGASAGLKAAEAFTLIREVT